MKIICTVAAALFIINTYWRQKTASNRSDFPKCCYSNCVWCSWQVCSRNINSYVEKLSAFTSREGHICHWNSSLLQYITAKSLIATVWHHFWLSNLILLKQGSTITAQGEGSAGGSWVGYVTSECINKLAAEGRAEAKSCGPPCHIIHTCAEERSARFFPPAGSMRQSRSGAGTHNQPSIKWCNGRTAQQNIFIPMQCLSLSSSKRTALTKHWKFSTTQVRIHSHTH